ncbi:L-sorbosone dehydrogenase [Olavius algarvensis associated proteobacterium Delta 3]|nr:L-sorbosone dehydrogenase [Olavius algarvensis associated proteobacterium Delta 3]
MNRWMAAWCFMLLLSAELAVAGASLPLHHIHMPEGFRIHVYTDSTPGARSLARSPSGILFVGTRRHGVVYAVVDRNGDYIADNVYRIAENLKMPNGVAFRDGDLYVAEIHRVIKFEDIERHLERPMAPVVVNDTFPDKEWHGWKFIRFGPDNLLYIPVGAPCNVCDEPDPRFASIMRMRPDGSRLEIFARGVRNTVGFDWHPDSQTLWFTDNGRDWLGDDRPPDELNHASGKGLHFGFPYFHGSDIPDPNFGKNKDLSPFSRPVQELGPHVAALGMRFYTGNMFPEKYQKMIFIAEHGSWNRSRPIGYRITMVRLQGDRSVAYDVFARGWLQGEEFGEDAWGRPVDLEVLPDGSMLVSDDRAGAIYRITYHEE